jgi:hypothetical protein
MILVIIWCKPSALQRALGSSTNWSRSWTACRLCFENAIFFLRQEITVFWSLISFFYVYINEKTCFIIDGMFIINTSPLLTNKTFQVSEAVHIQCDCHGVVSMCINGHTDPCDYMIWIDNAVLKYCIKCYTIKYSNYHWIVLIC